MLVCAGLGSDKVVTGDGVDMVAADDLGFFGDPDAPGGNDVVITGAGDDEILAGPGNDVVNGGPGDDILVGDLPTPEMGLPPIEDTGPNLDVCIGAGGTDQAFTCEREVAI